MIDADSLQAIHSAVLTPETLVRAVFSGARRGQSLPWQRVTIRPVTLKSGMVLQFSYFDAAKDITKNYGSEEARVYLDELLAFPFKNIHIETVHETVHYQFSKKDRLLTHREKKTAPTAVHLEHNREKRRILSLDAAHPFLKAVGILTQDGKIKADMQRKYRQVNEFLRVLDETSIFDAPGSPLHVVDFGCGNAYLTFATYYYLNHVRGIETSVVGVDLKSDLLESHRRKAASLGWDHLTFAEGRIDNYSPSPLPDVVIALHACDTATDDALAHGIRAGSRLIVTAPCCQHDLQAKLAKTPIPPPMLAVGRDGILNERLGDILTDTFRATLLRILGYRTDVIQFVSSEHTAKNLLIRSVKSPGAGNPQVIAEYHALKTFWGVTPYLETLLTDQLGQIKGF